MSYLDALETALRALRANATRTILTGIGMLIGNASVILVVTISLTSRGIRTGANPRGSAPT